MFSMTCLFFFLFAKELGVRPASGQGVLETREGLLLPECAFNKLKQHRKFTNIMHITAVPAYIAFYNLPDIFYGMKEHSRI